MISWALVLAAPFVVLPVIMATLQHELVASPTAWLGFGYASIISQFFAFLAWYQGLAIKGVARVSYIQLFLSGGSGSVSSAWKRAIFPAP